MTPSVVLTPSTTPLSRLAIIIKDLLRWKQNDGKLGYVSHLPGFFGFGMRICKDLGMRGETFRNLERLQGFGMNKA